MKGVVLLGDRECVVKEFPDPEPGRGEVRVRMIASGICGSDLHLYHMSKERAEKRGDRIPGHEPCGVVDKTGEGVTKVKEGDRVTIYHYLGCGYCDQCAAGNLMWCREARGYGGPVDGSHADFIIADERNCIIMPDSVSFIDGAFVACPAGTAYSSMSKLDVRSGDTVAVFGLGPVGLSGVVIAKALGGNVIGVDIADERTGLAKKLGADAVVNAQKENPVDAVRKFSDGGAALAFEASGSDKGRSDIVSSLRRGGVLSFAIHTTDLICQFAGYDPVSVSGFVSEPSGDVPDGYMPEPAVIGATIRHASGVTSYHVGQHGKAGAFAVDVLGSEGTLKAGMYAGTVLHDKDGKLVDNSTLELPENASVFKTAYGQIAAYLDGGEMPHCTKPDYIAINEIGFAMIESSLTGRTIDIPCQKRDRLIFANG